MTYTLFIDDERHPTPDLINVRVARTCEEAMELIQSLGAPTCISFDHDLGCDEHGNVRHNAHLFLRWLVEEHLDGKVDLNLVEHIIVHSNNPAGAKNIHGLWLGFAQACLTRNPPASAVIRPRNSLID